MLQGNKFVGKGSQTQLIFFFFNPRKSLRFIDSVSWQVTWTHRTASDQQPAYKWLSKCRHTCAGVRLLGADLQEDKCREEQEPATGPVRGLSGQGPPAPAGRIQDPTGTARPRVQDAGGGDVGGRCFQRPQGHGGQSVCGWRGHDWRSRIVSHSAGSVLQFLSFLLLGFFRVFSLRAELALLFSLLSGYALIPQNKSLLLSQLLLQLLHRHFWLKTLPGESFWLTKCLSLPVGRLSLVLEVYVHHFVPLKSAHRLFKYLPSRCCQIAPSQVDHTHSEIIVDVR